MNPDLDDAAELQPSKGQIKYTLDVIDGKHAEKQMSIVASNAELLFKQQYIVRFRGRPMILDYAGFPHFVPLHKERFDRMAYPILGGVTRSRMNDVFAYLGSTAEDLTGYEKLILFGVPLDQIANMEIEADTDIASLAKPPSIWDMEELMVRPDQIPAQCVWRSPHRPVELDKDAKGRPIKIPFIMDLAGNDPDMYDDIMQSIAPMIMSKKPDGVVWWIGDGANGKSTLMDALYRIFPGQLSSITVKRLVDGRDTPSLNGTLANIVKESSEGRVEDTEIYKALGTHENFRVHKFHSQDDVEIQGNLHHIFSANNIPTFNDKGWSARRRTFIIPFGQRFASNPNFEEETFNPKLFGQIISEMCRYAKLIERRGFNYKWSAKTLAAKANYDAEASNAEVYAQHLISQGVMAFEGFGAVKTDYENWCADEGYVPLGITNLRRAIEALGFERVSARQDSSVKKIHRLSNAGPGELQAISVGRPGIYTTPGWADEAKEVVDNAEAKKTEEPESPKQQTILKGKW